MKFLVLTILFLSTSLFANYAYQGENSGKIDMHGGKGDKLSSGISKFKTPNVSPLGGLAVDKPTSPFSPSPLIKKEEKKAKDKVEKTSKETNKTSETKESK